MPQARPDTILYSEQRKYCTGSILSLGLKREGIMHKNSLKMEDATLLSQDFLEVGGVRVIQLPSM